MGGKKLLNFLRGMGGGIRLLLSVNPFDFADCSLCAKSQQQQQWHKGLRMSSLLLQCLEIPYLQDTIIDEKKEEKKL